MLQRQISLDREETETGLEALEEPLKAKKRRESRQGTTTLAIAKLLIISLDNLSHIYFKIIQAIQISILQEISII